MKPHTQIIATVDSISSAWFKKVPENKEDGDRREGKGRKRGRDIPAMALPPMGIALICATDHRGVPSGFVRLLSQRLKSVCA